ncbi:MAG: histidine kinase [Holophagaceae bacterium]|nr:histidine kinase [Holophagaceae bacterium]
MKAWLKTWTWYWSAWVLLGLYMSTMDMVMYPKESFVRLILLNVLQNLAWGVSGLGILALAKRWPFERFAWSEWRVLLIHLIGSVVIALLGLVVVWAIAILFSEPSYRSKVMEMPFKAFRRFFSIYYHVNLILMWAVLGAFHGFRIHRRLQEQELEASQLGTRLAQAQNQALRMQLQPHFLFNTLNSISALIHSDPESADRMLSRLADLLRLTLESGVAQEVTLRQELAFSRGYLAIERIRFEDRLRVDEEIEPDCLEARVPSFLLQPLVENAIKHGVADLARPSRIQIRARKDGDALVLEVEDDGRGFEPGRRGIGTGTTVERLQLLYKDRQSFSLVTESGKGTLARIRLPWQVEAPAKEEAP